MTSIIKNDKPYKREIQPLLLSTKSFSEIIEKYKGIALVYISLQSATAYLVKPRDKLKEVMAKYTSGVLYYELTLDILTKSNEPQTKDRYLKLAISTTPVVLKIPNTKHYAYSLGNSAYLLPLDIKALKIFIKTIGVGRPQFGEVITKYFSDEKLYRYRNINNLLKQVMKIAEDYNI